MKKAAVVGVALLLAAGALAAAFPTLQRRRELDCDLQGVDRVEVRRAGGRSSSGGYCSCPMVQERLLYGTADAEAIEELRRAFDLGWHWGAESCDCCGSLTIEFFRGPHLALSVNFHGLDQARFHRKGWGDLSFTARGRSRLAAWLAARGLQI